MKIAVVVEAFPKLSETFILYHIIGLIDKGHTVNVFATGEEDENLIHKDALKYKYKSFTFFSVSRPIGYKRIFKALKIIATNISTHGPLLKTFNYFKYGSYGLKGYLFYDLEMFAGAELKTYDIIHSHFGNNGVRVNQARSLGLIEGKHVVKFHGHDLLRDDFISSYDNYRALFKNLDGIIFNSVFLNKVFFKKFPQHQNILNTVEGEPLETEKFPFTIRSNTTDQYSIITVGRLVSWKGQKLVIDAVLAAKKDYPNLKLRYNIVGDGEDYLELQKYIQEQDLEGIVILHGAKKQDEVYQLLKESDVFVLFGITNYRGEIDTQGVVIQEASSSGLPVIISDAGGMKEGVLDGETGFVVPEGNMQALVEHIKLLQEDYELRLKMGQKGQEFVKRKFSAQTIAQQSLDFYNTLYFRKKGQNNDNN